MLSAVFVLPQVGVPGGKQMPADGFSRCAMRITLRYVTPSRELSMSLFLVSGRGKISHSSLKEGVED